MAVSASVFALTWRDGNRIQIAAYQLDGSQFRPAGMANLTAEAESEPAIVGVPGGFTVVWSDAILGDRDLYAQTFDCLP